MPAPMPGAAAGLPPDLSQAFEQVAPPAAAGPTDMAPLIEGTADPALAGDTLSIPVEQGIAVIPASMGGKPMAPEEAMARFEATGEHFGIFGDPATADAFGQMLKMKSQAGGMGGAPPGIPPELLAALMAGGAGGGPPMLDSGAKAPPYPPRHMLEGPMG